MKPFEEILNTVTCNGMRELTYERAKQAVEEYESQLPQKEYEPYFGWCDVEGCDNEGCSGGNAWNSTGYWTVCSQHANDARKGKHQPQMKQSAIDRENSRLPDRTLPIKTI